LEPIDELLGNQVSRREQECFDGGLLFSCQRREAIAVSRYLRTRYFLETNLNQLFIVFHFSHNVESSHEPSPAL
jgi:hypothetical protein